VINRFSIFSFVADIFLSINLKLIDNILFLKAYDKATAIGNAAIMNAINIDNIHFTDLLMFNFPINPHPIPMQIAATKAIIDDWFMPKYAIRNSPITNDATIADGNVVYSAIIIIGRLRKSRYISDVTCTLKTISRQPSNPAINPVNTFLCIVEEGVAIFSLNNWLLKVINDIMIVALKNNSFANSYIFHLYPFVFFDLFIIIIL